MKPLAIDLFCGLGGWTEGLLAEGYEVVGFDIEQHQYGDQTYPAQLVVQDVLTLHGSQFRNAALIVASPPCQEYSYMAMPWSKAKAKAAAIRADETGAEVERLNRLFKACFRLQREASEAAGRPIPLVVENVKGAQPWVGRARWAYGSFFLWGDVPALMPIQRYHQRLKVPEGSQWNINRANFTGTQGWDTGVKVPGLNWSDRTRKGQAFNPAAQGAAFREELARKNSGGSWFNIGSPGQKETGKNPVHKLAAEGVKDRDPDGYERNHPNAFGWKMPRTTSKGAARRAASAMIAKIPSPLSRHIARVFRPIA